MYINNSNQKEETEQETITGKYDRSYTTVTSETKDKQPCDQKTAEKYQYSKANPSFSEFDTNVNLVSDLFKEKLREQKELINQTLYLINQRQNLFKRNISELEKAICRTHTLEYSFLIPRYEFHSPANRKNRITLQKTVNDIESKKSNEYLNCWQDVMRLKKDLLPLISEYLRTKKKLDMLAEKEIQDEIFNPYLSKEYKKEYKKETKKYVFPTRIP